MSENPSVKSSTVLTEAPASWNTRYTTPEGFVCQITLRAESGMDLLVKAQAAIAHLLEVGCTPCDNLTFRPRSNGNGNDGKPKNDNGSNGNGNHSETNAEGTSSNKLCPIHNVEMKRWEKNGKVWFSHKLESGSCCTGKGK